jgi:Zn-dependent protease
LEGIQVSEKLILFLLFLPLFFISLAVHEFAHAYAAYKYGDPTAKNLGRLTLNPYKHIDLIGTIVMPIMAFATGFAIIGWAKPVPVNSRNFKDPLKNDAVVSFVGPLSNFILSIIFLTIFTVVYKMYPINPVTAMIIKILWFAVYLNIFLFAFNLLPIPPLDGSHILFDLFPNKITAKIQSFGIYGSVILMIFIYSPLWRYFSEVINALLSLLVQIAGLK